MGEKISENIVFTIIRRGLELDDEQITLSKEEFDELIRVGKRQAILPVIYRGFRNLDLPKGAIERIKRLRLEDVYLFMQREALLEQIQECFNKAGISYILLKGAVICNLYPEPWMRTCSDIDILVHESDLKNAIRILECETELKEKIRNFHDVVMFNNQVVLELHFSIMESIDEIDKLLSKVWRYVEYSKEGTKYRLTPEYQIFHIIAHMSYHIKNGGIGIRQFIDLWFLRNRTRYDEGIVRSFCDTCGLLKFYETCCALSDVWFNKIEHTETTKLLEKYCLKGGVFGNQALAVAGRQRGINEKPYIVQRLFVKKSVLKEMYPDMKSGGMRMDLFYQIKRWLRLLDKHKRADAIREIKIADNVNQKDIDAYDRLLSSIGL